MKIKLTLKDPDGVSQATDEAVKIGIPESLSDEEREMIQETRSQKLREELSPWIKYAEYVRIEIDTDANTATVLKND